MAMYSASLAPHVGRAPTWKKALLAYFMADQPYAVAHEDYEANPARPLGGKLAIFFGAATPICGSWYVATLAGAMLGQAIPPEFALDFAVPITFLAIVAPLMRSLPHLVAAGVSVAGTLALSFVPNGMGLLIAALAAMAAGAQTETWLARRRAQQS